MPIATGIAVLVRQPYILAYQFLISDLKTIHYFIVVLSTDAHGFNELPAYFLASKLSEIY